MILIAGYADVGPGLAFLLLLMLSSAGLAVLLFRSLSKSTRLGAGKRYVLAAGFLQAWLVYFWARGCASEISRQTLEWAWVVSLGIVVVSLTATFLGCRPKG